MQTECRGHRGAALATAMALLILSFLAAMAGGSYLAWRVLLSQLGFPFMSPAPLAVTGFLIALLGIAGLVWVYSVFNPLVMLCTTIQGLPKLALTAVSIALRGSKPGQCMERRRLIVASGPYRCVRHPLYSSVIITFIGLSVALPWLLAALLLLVIIYYILSRLEEAELDDETCGKYSRVMNGIPRLNPLAMLLCIIGAVGHVFRIRSPWSKDT